MNHMKLVQMKWKFKYLLLMAVLRLLMVHILMAKKCKYLHVYLLILKNQCRFLPNKFGLSEFKFVILLLKKTLLINLYKCISSICENHSCNAYSFISYNNIFVNTLKIFLIKANIVLLQKLLNKINMSNN